MEARSIERVIYYIHTRISLPKDRLRHLKVNELVAVREAGFKVSSATLVDPEGKLCSKSAKPIPGIRLVPDRRESGR